MQKLATGNMPRAALPHHADAAKAAAAFSGFTLDSVETLVNAFHIADGVEAELVAKIGFAVITQRMAVTFNPALKEHGLDAKRLKIVAIAALSMSGRPVFKNCADTAQGMTAEDAEAWIAEQIRLGFKFLNRIEARWRMGAKVASEAYKIRAVVVQCLQAKTQHAGLVAFLDASREIVARVMGEFKTAAKPKTGEPDVLKAISKYLEDKATGLPSADIAALIGTLNTLHNAALAVEAAAMARDAADADDEEDMAEAA